jgi:hypothetical protein
MLWHPARTPRRQGLGYVVQTDMNRRSFFRRTVGAALAGFAAPFIAKKDTGITHYLLPYDFDELQREPNPAWVDAPYEIWFAAEDWTKMIPGGPFPKNMGNTIRNKS